MAERGVQPRPPYRSVRALTAWAGHRLPYLRGRLLLAGIDRELTLQEFIDFAEAALIEPVLHGSMETVDGVLDKLDTAIREAMPEREEWGTSAAAQAAHAVAESTFGAAPRRK